MCLLCRRVNFNKMGTVRFADTLRIKQNDTDTYVKDRHHKNLSDWHFSPDTSTTHFIW